MNNVETIRLLCIVTDVDLKVRHSSFSTVVPLEEEFGAIIECLVNVTPSLKGVDYGRFRFYKPSPGYPIHVSEPLSGLQLAEEHLVPLYTPYLVKDWFQKKSAEHRLHIDLIARVDFSEQCNVTLHRLESEEPSRSFRSHVTFQLETRTELQTPPHSALDKNGVTPTANDKELPAFVQQLKEESDFQRTIRCDGAALPLLGCLRVLLGDDFSRYFTDSNDGSETRLVSTLELLHYVITLLDDHLSDVDAYAEKAESHVYSLLRRFANPSPPIPDAKSAFGLAWSLSLFVKAVEDEGGQLSQYAPHSDFSVSISGLPYLLLEVASDKVKGRDKTRMLLQASCIVRLGNALLTDKSPTFFVRAIYIDHRYRAFEYTLYQRQSKPDDNAPEFLRVSNKRDTFILIFRLYNFLYSMRALHQRLSPRLTAALSLIQSDARGLPSVTTKRASDDTVGSAPKRKHTPSTAHSR
ncbi:hypothetical protein EDB84DRAFT_1564324 [Lactarius hengduanensis]|nr:hypothetical protein EDB84DRAFT_1564324 [Lactarius hengduanensis]